MVKTILLMIATVLVLWGCTGSSGGVALTADGFEVQNVSGSSTQRVVKRDENGNILEVGYLRDGVQEGMWKTYYPEKNLPKTITHFVNGNVHGIYLEFNDRGQIELRASYQDNKLDGPWGKFRFGRPTHLAHYKNGQYDGVYQEFNIRDGKIMKEIHYKGGQYHGSFKYFNEVGEVTLEYEYANGEKVGGGEIDPNRPNEPK